MKLDWMQIFSIILASGVIGTVAAGVFTLLNSALERRANRGRESATISKLEAERTGVYTAAAISLIDQLQEDNAILREQLDLLQARVVALEQAAAEALIREQAAAREMAELKRELSNQRRMYKRLRENLRRAVAQIVDLGHVPDVDADLLEQERPE